MNKNILEGSVVDAALADLSDAYRGSLKLRTVTNAKEAQREGAKITQAISLAMNQLVVLGIHAEKRWEALEKESGPN